MLTLVDEMTSMRKVCKGGSSFSALNFATMLTGQLQAANDEWEEKLTCISAFECLLTNDESLNVGFPGCGSIYVCDGNNLRCYFRFEEFDKVVNVLGARG